MNSALSLQPLELGRNLLDISEPTQVFEAINLLRVPYPRPVGLHISFTSILVLFTLYYKRVIWFFLDLLPGSVTECSWMGIGNHMFLGA